MTAGGLFADTFQVPFNINSLVPGQTSQFQAPLSMNVLFDNKGGVWEVCVQDLVIFNSIQNVSQAQTNNAYSYVWVDGTTNVVQMPNGLYSIADIGNFLVATMTTNKHYLVLTNATTMATSNVYFLNLVENATYYGAQFTSTPMDSTTYSSGNGYARPAGATWTIPASSTNPQMVVPSPSGFNTPTFGSLIGFPAGSFPSAQTPGALYSYISGFNPGSVPGYAGGSNSTSFIPEIAPVASVQVQCNVANNPYLNTPSILTAFSLGAIPFGGAFTLNIPEFTWVPVTPNIASGNIKISFVDQNGNPIVLLDPQIQVTLLFRKRPLR